MRLRFIAKPNPTGSYRDSQYDRVRAFRLLAHAEIESCIEDLVTDLADAAYLGWKSDGRARTTLVALVGHVDTQHLPKEWGQKALADRIAYSRAAFVRHAQWANHGITQSDLMKLFYPVGLTEADLDPVWLLTVQAFAVQRGDTAHRGLRTKQQPDPQQERQTVEAILKGLKDIDARLTELREH